MLDVPFFAKLLGVCDGARGGTRGGESCACLPYNAQYQIYKEEIMAHRVLYYVCDGKTDAAESVLAGIEGGDQIELMGCAHKPFVCPTAEQLRGCSGFIGEFGPVLGDAVDAVASAGVQIVSSMSIGLNHIDVAGLMARGVTVTNCPGYCADDVAQHTIALMLDLMRKVTFCNHDVLGGEWNPVGGYVSHRTQGQTLGLVFFGSIARSVVPIARALGMNVLVWALTKSAEELEEVGCTKANTLDELLSASDVVSLHCPLIPETQGLIGERELALMKPAAFLVNTARGPVVDEAALLHALDEYAESGGERGICAAGLDVLDDETAPNRALIEHPRCVVTPHTAYCTAEANDTLRRMTLQAVVDKLVFGREPQNVVRV